MLDTVKEIAICNSMGSFVTGLITKAFQQYWRFSRALTLGAQGAIFDDAGRVLLIRHTYRPGWHFPGGGVEKTETVRAALARELEEEAGIVIDHDPVLFAIYANFEQFPGDHIALYTIRSWQQRRVPSRNAEIAEQNFFACDALPRQTSLPTRRRIEEIVNNLKPALMW